MKKIFCIVLLFISVVSASAQKTVGELRKGFKQGCFYLKVDDNRTLFFTAEYDGSDINKAVFTTKVDGEQYKKGNEWFKNGMKTEEGNMAMFDLFYENYGILIDDDIKENDDGSVSVTLLLQK